MKRTDFSVDWLFAACAPDTELLPWNAQFTPVDLPHDWQIRHADDLYRDGTLFLPQIFLCHRCTRHPPHALVRRGLHGYDRFRQRHRSRPMEVRLHVVLVRHHRRAP